MVSGRIAGAKDQVVRPELVAVGTVNRQSGSMGAKCHDEGFSPS
jgi:hypothetical protein